MKVEFHGRNAEITDRLRDHADPRLAALEGLYDRIQDVRVTLSGQKGWKTIEITLDADGVLLRSERVRSHPRTAERASPLARTEPTVGEGEEPEELSDLDMGAIEITRIKSHPLKPMTPEEAALQMELLAHDFFMFFNPQSNQVELVYRRRSGGYGLIEPVLG